MACLPGDPCYNSFYHPGENCGCAECQTISSRVTYDGPNLPCTGVRTGDIVLCLK